MKVGLRIDVDTFRGTRRGVPSLLRAFDRAGIRGSFFFSAGPDNMGRHLWRLLKPQFLWKMLRTKAVGLYGPEIVLMGTCWPGPMIAKHNAGVIRDASSAGHEIGVHAWDHHYWQAESGSMSAETAFSHVKRAFDLLSEITGKPPSCSASPGWRCTEQLLLAKEQLPFAYNSDCRGDFMFRPVVNGKELSQIQVPLNLPTYDEVLGRNGITNENYNDFLLAKIQEHPGYNVLTVHAEAEGGLCSAMFDDFLARAKTEGIEFVPLSQLIPADRSGLPQGRLVRIEIPGREGWVAGYERLP